MRLVVMSASGVTRGRVVARIGDARDDVCPGKLMHFADKRSDTACQIGSNFGARPSDVLKFDHDDSGVPPSTSMKLSLLQTVQILHTHSRSSTTCLRSTEREVLAIVIISLYWKL